MYKLCVYIPSDYLEQVKSALFDAGAGTVGQYDQCCWQTLGSGQFRPLAGSQPFLGNTHQLETVEEFKVEMVVKDALIKTVIAHMKQAHPYEEPAYDVWPLSDF